MSLPDVSPTSVICFGDSTFLQHVVAHVDKDLKLLFTSESVCSIAFFHDAEHLCFGSNHEKRETTITIMERRYNISTSSAYTQTEGVSQYCNQ